MTYDWNLRGLETLLAATERGPEEVAFCSRFHEALESCWDVPGTWLEFKPSRAGARNTVQSYQYLCRVCALPHGQKEYDWTLPGFAKRAGAGCSVEITGDRSGWPQRIPEFDQQVFWGLRIPRAEAAHADIQGRGIPEEVKTFGRGPAEFIDRILKGPSFGTWYYLGFRVRSTHLEAWASEGGLDALVEAAAGGLAGVYRTCHGVYGIDQSQPPRYPDREDLRRALEALQGSEEVRVPVEQVLEELASLGGRRWAADWREHVRRELAGWVTRLAEEG